MQAPLARAALVLTTKERMMSCGHDATLARGVLPTNKGNHSRASYMRSPTLALLQTRPPYFIKTTAR